MSSLDYLDLCRLCLVKDRVGIPIFEDDGDVRQVFLKIASCLPVKVSREDKLPKKICDDCMYKLELFYQFWNTTANAEKQLLQWLDDVDMQDKQGYVTEVLNSSIMKQEQQASENRLDESVMQVSHQNNMGMGMMDNMGLGMPIIISTTNQPMTSVPMDTSVSSVQTIQAVPGTSTQSTHDQISQNQSANVAHHEVDEDSDEDEENESDDECDADDGLPVKEENEEDPNNRTVEPTTFVNVSLPCDEAGPSGLQQQKITEMPEMAMPQVASADNKTGLIWGDPLFISEEKYLENESVEETSTLLPSASLLSSSSSSSSTANLIEISNLDNSKKSRALYLCEHCEFTESDKIATDKHNKEHNFSNRFICKICNIEFVTYAFLEGHVKKIHRKLPYVCGECDFKCKDYGNIRNMWFHMRARHVIITGDKLRPLICKICGFQNTSNEMWRHMESVHLKTGYQCKICKWYLPSQTKIHAHAQEKHVTKFIPILPKKGKAAPRIEGRYVPIGPPRNNVKAQTVTLKNPFQSLGQLIFPSTESVQVRYQPHLRTKVCLVCGVGYSREIVLCKHIQQMKSETKQ